MMRDLRAELRDCDDIAPVEWKPAEADILVGFVRDASSFGAIKVESNTVIVEEERTGMPVLVSLDSPQLAALFELHNPHGNDRIGIKCVGHDSTGAARFTMLVDRESPRQGQADHEEACGDKSKANDDCCAATLEEREHIERMLSAQTSTRESNGSADAPSARIEGTIRREEEELARQTRYLERLEALIGRSLPQAEAPADSTPTGAHDQSQAPSARGGIRLRAWPIYLALLIACVIGAVFAFLKPASHLWIR